MSTLPNEVREAGAKAICRANPEWAPICLDNGPAGRAPCSTENCLAARAFDAALSALEAAGWEVNRKGTREALEPFAKLAADIDGDEFGSALDDNMLIGVCSSYEVPISNPTIGDLRRAAALLTASNPKEKPMGPPQVEAEKGSE